MVSKIAAVILNFNEPNSYVDRNKALEIAEVILQVQEENGMQPPNVTLDELFPGFLTEIGDKHYYACWEDE